MSRTLRHVRYAALDRALGAGLLPDPLLRAGSRVGARARIHREERGGVQAQEERLTGLLARMRSGPIAEHTASANEQHYELPPAFFELLLGPRMKYSSALWSEGVHDLAGAEEAMLRLTATRAGIADGMHILDLGCGWGSFSLYVCEHFANVRVLAVSNSRTQREWIETTAARRGLSDRLEVRTVDANELTFEEERFDRVVSVEAFEHMRNWEELLARIASWLEPDGRLFVHVFSHRRLAYEFEATWAADRFFTAGRMPSHDLILRFQRDLQVVESWALPGTHYARTLGAWLERLDANPDRARELLADAVGRRRAGRAPATWRLFLLSTREMWGWRGGEEWMVSHHLLAPRAPR